MWRRCALRRGVSSMLPVQEHVRSFKTIPGVAGYVAENREGGKHFDKSLMWLRHVRTFADELHALYMNQGQTGDGEQEDPSPSDLDLYFLADKPKEDAIKAMIAVFRSEVLVSAASGGGAEGDPQFYRLPCLFKTHYACFDMHNRWFWEVEASNLGRHLAAAYFSVLQRKGVFLESHVDFGDFPEVLSHGHQRLVGALQRLRLDFRSPRVHPQVVPLRASDADALEVQRGVMRGASAVVGFPACQAVDESEPDERGAFFVFRQGEGEGEGGEQKEGSEERYPAGEVLAGVQVCQTSVVPSSSPLRAYAQALRVVRPPLRLLLCAPFIKPGCEAEFGAVVESVCAMSGVSRADILAESRDENMNRLLPGSNRFGTGTGAAMSVSEESSQGSGQAASGSREKEGGQTEEEAVEESRRKMEKLAQIGRRQRLGESQAAVTAVTFGLSPEESAALMRSSFKFPPELAAAE
eukprot:Cvel_33214.t1-p1 / transcript=Cvel_33214.t1 / gene=Cvel_33214 / organism=Chromera_velia_CCMP2878 / gene_product=hypothetical protein / transcript_product=hypothetical protein / location=Cvel_scaffold5341:50-4936(-) / protein_length=465 / sequence_SO=supercontig / SO=protein_coding / is_pseudo=false